MKEYTRELVGFLQSLEARDLPVEVADRARYFLLDYLAVAIRGSREESAEAVQRMVQRIGANGCSTILGTRIRTIASLAALANGAAAHGIEQDDTHSGGSIHLGATMYSAAFALAETMPSMPMNSFLTAVVAGFEAAARVAMAVQPREHRTDAVQPLACPFRSFGLPSFLDLLCAKVLEILDDRRFDSEQRRSNRTRSG
jgi:2-methylcitrate dehydratase PrpD